MKITKTRLKEIILEEIDSMDETLSPMDFSAGRDPDVSRPPDMAGPAVDPEPEGPTISNFRDLFDKILSAPGGKLSLSKADTTILAGLIAQRNLQE